MSYLSTQPTIKIGIVEGPEIEFTLKGLYRNQLDNQLFDSRYFNAKADGNLMVIDQQPFTRLHLVPVDDGCEFIIHQVLIGIGFHWERKEDQVFKGELIIENHELKLLAINNLCVDDYLISVISSEMSATSSLQLLKAHAVISRSWLLAQIEKNQHQMGHPLKYQSHFVTDIEITRWYDREDHAHFDVCADDHCQRYQGISRVTTGTVAQAVNETKGVVLTHEGKICDARFSKSCGGKTELFENCWEPHVHPYLQSFVDAKELLNEGDLTVEQNAVAWIKSSPKVFCNSHDVTVLQQVLNHYDQETHQFFRWKVEYSQMELSDLVRQKTGIDFGLITHLIPLTRGRSGRIIRLQIEGTNKSLIIGKELEIRKALSPSHLYSSAFYVVESLIDNQLHFVLHGAGWGHGVGLCQIGAAVMGEKGYSFSDILMHYFKGAQLEKRY